MSTRGRSPGVDISTEGHIQGGPKHKPLLLYRQNVPKPADKTTFSLKMNVEQATEVNANKHLLVLNIL